MLELDIWVMWGGGRAAHEIKSGILEPWNLGSLEPIEPWNPPWNPGTLKKAPESFAAKVDMCGFFNMLKHVCQIVLAVLVQSLNGRMLR